MLHISECMECSGSQLCLIVIGYHDTSYLQRDDASECHKTFKQNAKLLGYCVPSRVVI